MTKNNNKTSLELKPIRTKLDTKKGIANPIETIKNTFREEGFVVAYLYHEVLIGRYKNQKMILYKNESIDPGHIIKIRVFNENKELFIWKTSEGFNYRLREDDETIEEGDAKNGSQVLCGKEAEENEGTKKVVYVVDARQVLWGTKIEEKYGDFTLITEDRGTQLILPFTVNSKLKELDAKENRVFLKTRNYIDYNQLCQATYVDSRFMGFRIGKQDLPIEEK
jgi:CRISPR-associated protein (TIGR03984 family)